MDLIGWLLRLAFFILALWFALQNTAPVPLRLSPTQGWAQVPLIIVILSCFVAGALAGMLALVPHLLRQRRRLAALARDSKTQAAPATVGSESLSDVARQVGAVGGLEMDTRSRRR
jgi:lipopolysaccharide assembly protein A